MTSSSWRCPCSGTASVGARHRCARSTTTRSCASPDHRPDRRADRGRRHAGLGTERGRDRARTHGTRGPAAADHLHRHRAGGRGLQHRHHGPVLPRLPGRRPGHRLVVVRPPRARRRPGRLPRPQPARRRWGRSSTRCTASTTTRRWSKPWLEVTNDSNLPIGLPGRVIGVRAQSSRQWLSKVSLSRRGTFRIGPVRVRTGDPFGLFTSEMMVGRPTTVVVFPKVYALPHWRLPPGPIEGTAATRRRREMASPWRPPSGPTRPAMPSTASTG